MWYITIPSSTILAVSKVATLTVTKMFDFEARVLIGWLASQLEVERVLQSQTFLFYIKVAYLSYGEYSIDSYMYTWLSQKLQDASFHNDK